MHRKGEEGKVCRDTTRVGRCATKDRPQRPSCSGVVCAAPQHHITHSTAGRPEPAQGGVGGDRNNRGTRGRKNHVGKTRCARVALWRTPAFAQGGRGGGRGSEHVPPARGRARGGTLVCVGADEDYRGLTKVAVVMSRSHNTPHGVVCSLTSPWPASPASARVLGTPLTLQTCRALPCCRSSGRARGITEAAHGHPYHNSVPCCRGNQFVWFIRVNDAGESFARPASRRMGHALCGGHRSSQ